MMKKDKKTMNYPKDFKLGYGDREFADANNKGLVVHYSDDAVMLCKWYKDGAKEHNGLTYVYIEFSMGWSAVAELEFDFDADGWWYGSKLFDSHEQISKFWHSEMGYEFVSEKDKREREIDSLVNSHICEMSEGMMSLSHVG